MSKINDFISQLLEVFENDCNSGQCESVNEVLNNDKKVEDYDA